MAPATNSYPGAAGAKAESIVILGQASADPWFWVAILACAVAGLACATLVGLGWGIIRERHLVDLSRDQEQATHSVERTIDVGTVTLKMGMESLTEAVRAIERQVEKAGELSDKHREEFIRLAIDIEIRIGNLLRDLLKQPPASIVNQVSTGQSAANQAGEIRNG